MLAIRLQRVGRKGNAQYRIIVQESQKHPTSGRVVAPVGTYDPHTKAVKVQVELAQKFLDNGAQPSPRVVKLLTAAGVKMPNWVVKAQVNSKTVKNVAKLRKNQPVAEKVVEEPVVEAAESIDESIVTDTASETVVDTDVK